jgi:Protein of unknown function (DUF2800)
MDEERDNLPSASAVQRLMQCPASHRMTLKARGMRMEAGEHKKDGDRQHGLAMHDAIFAQSAAKLETDQDRMDYSKIMRRFREFLSGWGAGDDDIIIREERLWLHQEITPIFSGRPDYIRIRPNHKRAVIVDFKSLWNKAPEPVENDQLWSQAVLLAEEDPLIQEFTMQIISPNYMYKPHLASREEVKDYQTRLWYMLSLVQLETEPKTGDQCKHCGGLLICPAVAREAAGKSEHPSELKLENAGKLLARMERLEKYIKEVREYYKLVLAKDPDSIPGWGIKEKQMRILKDPAKIRDAVLPVIGEKAFWDACSVSITKLETSWTKKREAYLIDDPNKPQEAAQVLAPFITIQTKEASLVRKKK